MANVTIELSDQSAEFIDERIRTGGFRDREEVVIAALIAFKERIADFNAEVQIGIDAAERGEVIEVPDVRTWLAARRRSA
ncbi:hypothetical protein BH10PSE1_BH10PSE1_01930 [soil metagenome]